MAARSIASLTLGFGLVSIPVKLYSATESSSSIRFNLLAKDGSRVKQQYVSEKDGKVVERARRRELRQQRNRTHADRLLGESKTGEHRQGDQR